MPLGTGMGDVGAKGFDMGQPWTAQSICRGYYQRAAHWEMWKVSPGKRQSNVHGIDMSKEVSKRMSFAVHDKQFGQRMSIVARSWTTGSRRDPQLIRKTQTQIEIQNMLPEEPDEVNKDDA